MPMICIAPGCTIRASFGTPGTRSPLFCATHRLPGMMHRNLSCAEPGCSAMSTHRLPGGRFRTYCAVHKKPGMFYCLREVCVECRKLAKFGSASDPEQLFCAKHKKEDSICLKKLKSRQRCSPTPPPSPGVPDLPVLTWVDVFLETDYYERLM